MKFKDQINSLLPLNIILPDNSNQNPEENLNYIHKLMTYLAKNNIIFTMKALESLRNASIEYLYALTEALTPTLGTKFRDSFGEDQELTIQEINQQLTHYFVTYALDDIHSELLEDKRNKTLQDDEEESIFDRVRVLDSKTETEYISLLKDIINSSIVFGNTQRDILKTADEELLSLIIEDTQEMKIKENMLFLISINKNAKKFLKTSTDLLRYIYYLNEIDYQDIKSTPTQDLMIRLKTSQKRFIMEFLNSLDRNSALEEFKRYRPQWIRVSNNLKPLSYKYLKYYRTRELFRVLKNDKIRTFFSFYDTLDVLQKAEHLSQRPGEFIRRLDSLLRENKHIFEIKEIIDNTDFNPKLLMQIIPYLKYRADYGIENRIFNVKGKPFQSDKSLEKLDTYSTSIIIGALSEKLIKHLKTKTPFNHFILDEEIKNYIVPTEIRDLSVSNNIRYTPGTRIKFDCNYLRAFSAWGTKEEDGLFDIDLGGMFVDKNNEFTPIAYYNQNEEFASHSGDFTSCTKYTPGDNTITAEFIDINIEKAKELYNYAVFNTFIFASEYHKEDFDTDIYSYTGIMERDTRSTKSININNSEFKMTLSGDYKSNTSFAVDFQKSEIVFIDKYSKSNSGSNIDTNANSIDLYRREYFDAYKYKMNMFELLSSINNPELKDGENPIVIDNQFVSDNLESIFNLLQ